MDNLHRYDDPKLKASGGFVLISALWFDVMKEFFVSGKTMARNDIGLLFTRIYEDIEEVKVCYAQLCCSLR